MFEIEKLDNGIKIVFCKLENFRSLSIGYWIKSGSAYENSYSNGVSHFIEHMLFNGTKHRSQMQIVNDIESLGGDINAFTTKELTCIYTKTLDEHYKEAIDVLSDIYNYSEFSSAGIEKEKKVISQEIKMYLDTPDEKIHDLIEETIWKGCDFERSVLGNFKSVENITQNEIKKYFDTHYVMKNTVISVAGNFNKDYIMEELNNKLLPKNSKNNENNINAKYTKNFNFQKRKTEQNHVCIAYEGFSLNNIDRYTLNIINSFFGSGMSSRLFQSIRETLGLVYNVFAYINSNTISGSYVIYAGLDSENTKKFIKSVDIEIEKLLSNGIDKTELEINKNKIKSGLIMGFESSSSLMSYAGKSLLLTDSIREFDQIIKYIDDINTKDVLNIANSVFNKEKQSVAIIGESY